MSRVLLRHIFPSAPSTLCSSTTWPRRLCVTDLGHCAVAPRVLQRRPSWHPGVDTGTTPARSRETRARLETTRPCNSWELHWLPIYCAANRVQIVSPPAQGPDWSGAGLHHQPAHAGHQHSIALFTARL